LAISAVPLHAQEQPSAVQLKADAKNVARIISGDKLKLQSYCKFADLSDQIDAAAERQDTKKAQELSQEAEELQRKLGPEFASLANGMQDMNLNSQDVREIGSILGKLDELCRD
jgi:methyl-accepting chemotaxis protein